MTKYKRLKNQIFILGEYSIVPIRFEDRYLIMNWRNEQMFHLRQETVLNKEEQDLYFKNVIAKSFKKKVPNQILFSYLKANECIGYGGLVHINWIDRNAEISFIMKTELEVVDFELHWKKFLTLINIVSKDELDLIKIFTYAFDLRPRLYNVLEACDFKLEARLRKHKIIDNKHVDVLIHSKLI